MNEIELRAEVERLQAALVEAVRTIQRLRDEVRALQGKDRA